MSDATVQPRPSRWQDQLDAIAAGALSEATLNELIAALLSHLATAERTAYLRQADADKANGFYERRLEAGSLPLSVHVPRTRSGTFRPSVLPPPYQRGFPDEKRNLILSLIVGARSLEAVRQTLRRLGLTVPDAELDQIVDDLDSELTLINSRPVPTDLLAIYYDGKYIEIRDKDRLRPFTIYTVVGILRNGKKRVLASQTIPGRESLEGWKKILKSLLERGLRRLLIAIHDDLPGLLALSQGLFPKADIQLCFVHMQRNAKRHLSKNLNRSFQLRLKSIRNSWDPETAANDFEQLCTDFQADAPTFIRAIRKKRIHYLAFLNYPDSVRATFSTTNAVEIVNRQIESARMTSGGYFQSQRLAHAKLAITIQNLEAKRWKKPATNIANALDELNLIFETRFETENTP